METSKKLLKAVFSRYPYTLKLRIIRIIVNRFLKIQQSNKMSILETVELVRTLRTVDQRCLPKGKLEIKRRCDISAAAFKPSLKLHSE